MAQVLFAGGAYLNLDGSRQALVAGAGYVNDATTSIGSTIYRPLSDVSAGSWTPSTGSDLFAMLNESSPDDGNYAQSSVSPTTDIMMVRFAAPGARPVNTGHIIRYRLYALGTLVMVVRLKQGGSTIKEWTHNPAPTTVTAFERTLSEGEASSLTSGDPMDIEVEAS